MIFRLAFRNLTRNKWRTLLTLAGIAAGVAMLSWTLAYLEGFIADLIRGATANDSGQVQLINEKYVEKSEIFETIRVTETQLKSIEALPGVTGATPRLNVFGLIGDDKKSVVAQITGVSPASELKTLNIAKNVIEGQWLDPKSDVDAQTRSIVLGHKLAKQLKAGIGSEIVLFFTAADGAMGNDVATVRGILKTGNDATDRRGAFVHIETLQYMAGLEEQYHTVAVSIGKVSDSKRIANKLAPMFEKPILVRPWEDVRPQIAQMIEVSGQSNIFLFFIVYLIVAFGLFNAQRMSALERRREFAMMMAIGVSPTSLFFVVLFETILLSLLGALIGAAMGGGLSWYHAIYGLDMNMFADGGSGGFSYMGVSFEDRMKFIVTASTVFSPVLGLLPVSFLCGAWPAIQAARTNIVTSISGRN